MLILIGADACHSSGDGDVVRRKAPMHEPDRQDEHMIRERAYFLWESAGRPDGQADDHWRRAIDHHAHAASDDHDALMDDEEKLLVGRGKVNMPALLTKDVPGG